jgi:hypothetical protein
MYLVLAPVSSSWRSRIIIATKNKIKICTLVHPTTSLSALISKSWLLIPPSPHELESVHTRSLDSPTMLLPKNWVVPYILQLLATSTITTERGWIFSKIGRNLADPVFSHPKMLILLLCVLLVTQLEVLLTSIATTTHMSAPPQFVSASMS